MVHVQKKRGLQDISTIFLLRRFYVEWVMNSGDLASNKKMEEIQVKMLDTAKNIGIQLIFFYLK